MKGSDPLRIRTSSVLTFLLPLIDMLLDWKMLTAIGLHIPGLTSAFQNTFNEEF